MRSDVWPVDTESKSVKHSLTCFRERTTILSMAATGRDAETFIRGRINLHIEFV